MALSFRSAASTTARRFSGVIAASLMAATQAVTPLPAAARDIEGLPPQCAQAGDELAKLKCGRQVFQGRTAGAQARSVDAKAHSVEAKQRSAAADNQIAINKTAKSCYDALLDEVNAAKKVSPLTPEQKTVFKARAAGCEKT